MNKIFCRPYHFRVVVLLLVPLLTIALLAPALAERPDQRNKRSREQGQKRTQQRQKAPQVQRQAPRQPRQQQANRPQRQPRQQQANRPQRQQRQQKVNQPQRQQRQQQVNRPQRQQRQQQVNRPQRQQRQQQVNRPQRQQRQQQVNHPQRQQRQQQVNHPQRQQRQQQVNRPQRQQRQQQVNRPQRQQRQQKVTRAPRQHENRKAQQHPRGDHNKRVNRGNDHNRNARNGKERVNWTRPGRIDTRKTRPTPQVVRQPVSNRQTRRDVNVNRNRNVNTNQNVNVNRNYNYNYNHNVVSQPAAYSYAAPAYSVVHHYNPYAYNDYYERRAYRRSYRENCSWPLLILGFFLSRPYSSYNYAAMDYNNQPYFYGDDTAYQAGPVQVASEGGPVPAAPTFDSEEERMLISLSEYVDAHSLDGAYQISDSAFGGQNWSLDLAQAPAVFEIEEGLYSVVAGFEGTLGGGGIPSNVNVEFFIARTDNGYEVRDSWITSANGIPRTRMYQSPAYPDVSTWEAGRLCPFTGQQMIPMEAHTSEHG